MPRRSYALCRKIPVSVSASLAASLLLPTSSASAETPEPDATARAETPPAAVVHNPFIQYGVSFTTELVASSSALCSSNPNVAPHCMLGSGAGFVFPRVGWRSPGHWYLGGAYEFSKQDAGTVYLLPILQQLRGEARYYFLEGHVWTPFAEGSLGVAGYGNEWTVDAYGPAASLAIGVEAQISRNTVVGATFAYRAIHFSGITDSAGNPRDSGFAQLVGINVQLEVRDPY